MSANWGLSVVVVVVAGAVAGHGDGGEAAGAGAEPGDASPVLRLLRGGEGGWWRRALRAHWPLSTAPIRTSALPPIRLAPPSLTAPPEAGRLVGDGGRMAPPPPCGERSASAPCGGCTGTTPVVGRRAHAGAAAHGRDADGRACSAAGELDARRGGGAVVRGGEDGPLGRLVAVAAAAMGDRRSRVDWEQWRREEERAVFVLPGWWFWQTERKWFWRLFIGTGWGSSVIYCRLGGGPGELVRAGVKEWWLGQVN